MLSITLKQAADSLVTPLDDARLYNLLAGGQVGVVSGVTVTSLGGNQLKVAAGWGVCQGRVFAVDEETIHATVSASGTVNGRLLVRIDIGNDTPIGFVTQAAATLPALTQEDINQSGTIYEIPLATYQIGEISVSGLTAQAPVCGSLVKPTYTATFLLTGWSGTAAPYTQTVTITPRVTGAPAVTAATQLLGAWYEPSTVAATNETLREALGCIAAGRAISGAGTVQAIVQEKPTCDITTIWMGGN